MSITNNRIGGSITGATGVSVNNVINTNNSITSPTASITGFNLPTTQPGVSGYVMVTNGTNTLSFTQSITGLEQTLALGNDSGVYDIIMGTATTIGTNGGTGRLLLDGLGDGDIVKMDASQGSRYARVVVDGYGEVNFIGQNGGTQSDMFINESGIQVSTTTGVGIEYSSDYSATFTNRSLVDKEYVDNAQAAGSFGITVDGGGSVITTGLQGFVIMPYSGTITEWTIIADQSGSSVIDIWKSTYASAPPTIANTITGSALPTLTTAQTAQSSTLTGWTTSVTTGDVIGFNVNSASSVTRLTLSIKITKS